MKHGEQSIDSIAMQQIDYLRQHGFVSEHQHMPYYNLRYENMAKACLYMLLKPAVSAAVGSAALLPAAQLFL